MGGIPDAGPPPVRVGHRQALKTNALIGYTGQGVLLWACARLFMPSLYPLEKIL